MRRIKFIIFSLLCFSAMSSLGQGEKSEKKEYITPNSLKTRLGFNMFSYANVEFEKKSSSLVNLYSTVGIKHGFNLLLKNGLFCNSQYVQEARKKKGIIGGLGVNVKFHKEPKLHYIIYAEYRRNFINDLVLDESCESSSSFVSINIYDLRVNELSGVITISQPTIPNGGTSYLSVGCGQIFGKRHYSIEGPLDWQKESSKVEDVSTFIVRFDVGIRGLLTQW